MFKRVLLVKPRYRTSHYEYAGLPPGLGYISESLFQNSIEHKIIDMSLNYKEMDLFNCINSFQPDLIGISMMSFRYKDHYLLTDKIKNEFKNCKIIAGGPHISTFREESLEECKSLDYAVTMEGEDAILELCKGKEYKEIGGLIYRENDRILYSGDRQFRTDLDNISFPQYRNFETNKYIKFISLVTSRGCPHNCIFCPVNLTIGHKLRTRSALSVADEIEYWHKKGFRVFNIVDDNFTFNKERVLNICGEIKKRGLKNLTFSCRNGVRADKVDKEMLKAMKEVGFNYLAFGIESGSEKILKILKKGENLLDMENAVRGACELGYMVTLFFIIGLPYETEEDIYKSFNFAKKFPVFDVRFYNPIPFPGTELYKWVKENNYFCETNIDYLNNASHWINEPIFQTPELPFSLRKKLYRELNCGIKRHTSKIKLFFSKDLEKLFVELGVPRIISRLLARLYYTELFQFIFIESGIIERVKRIINK